MQWSAIMSNVGRGAMRCTMLKPIGKGGWRCKIKEKPIEMTRDELIVAVPTHMRNGRPYLIALETIPQPWRGQFEKDLVGSACPVVVV